MKNKIILFLATAIASSYYFIENIATNFAQKNYSMKYVVIVNLVFPLIIGLLVGLINTEKIRIKKEIASMSAFFVINILMSFVVYYKGENRFSYYNIILVGYLFINIMVTILKLRRKDNDTSIG